jgi:hypothetical protein
VRLGGFRARFALCDVDPQTVEALIMTSPIHIGIGGHGGVIGTTGTVGGTLDLDKVRQIQLLAEASLVAFTATPAALTPFATARLAWNVAMPTTVLPGVTVEVVIEGLGGDLVGNGPGGTVLAQDSITVAPFGDTVYGVALRTPLAYRELGTLSLPVDFTACNSLDLPIAAFTNPIIATAKSQFVGNSQLKLRQDPTVDVGINSFVLSILLEVEVPDWRNANVDVTMAFSLKSERNGLIEAALDAANASVSPGPLSTILTAGCATAVADACESVINGFLWTSVGPTMVKLLADALNGAVATRRDQLGVNVVATTTKVPKFDLYDLAITNGGITMRMCPRR